MTEIQISSVAGVLLSLLFEYVPGFQATWHERLAPQDKRLIMLLVCLVVAVVAFLLSCYGPFDWFQCSQDGAWTAVLAFIAAVVSNQSTHRIMKRDSNS